MSLIRFVLLVFVVGCAGLGVAAGFAAPGDTRKPGRPPSPNAASKRPIALGTTVTDPAKDGPALDSFSATARDPALVAWYQSWNEPLFYPSQFAAVEGRSAVPMVTWVPDSRNGSVVSLRDIASGAHDDYLTAAAVQAKAWGRPFFIRFAHEMNGSWYSWGGGFGANTPGEYTAAWRHVVQLFRTNGASNVKWVWSPNVYGSSAVTSFKAFYPGDEWVDWAALDGYNWGPGKPSGFRSFTEVFGLSYRALEGLTDKPVMIGETASTEYGGDKASWIRSTFDHELPERFSRVRAVVWFNRDKEDNWRLDSSPGSARAIRKAAASPRYGLSGQALIEGKGWLALEP